jgi:hypothetical protein
MGSSNDNDILNKTKLSLNNFVRSINFINILLINSMVFAEKSITRVITI